MQRAIRAFQDFIDGLTEATDPAALQQVVSKALQNLQMPVFAYVGYPARVAVPVPPLIVATYPDGWAVRYSEQHYHRFDAVLACAGRELLPFDWGAESYLAALEPMPRRIFNEAREFGIARGFTVPIHDGQGKVATLNVATSEAARSFEKNVAENRHLLHLIGIYLHAHVRHNVQGTAVLGRTKLSSREIECLQWSALGKTYYDIGEILGISRRTVLFHAENAKRKLGVITLHQAIVAATMSGLIQL